MNEKVLGLVSGVRDGKQLLVTTPKRCSATAAGDLYLGLVSGVRDGKPLLVVSDFVCDAGALAVGQTYLGLVSGIRDGKPLLVVPCGDCDVETFCGCEICCTLDATIQFPTTLDDLALGWNAAVDTTLTCDGSFDITSFQFCSLVEIPEDPGICERNDTTYSGGTGSYVIGSQTFNWRTKVWVSPEESGGPSGLTFTQPTHGLITFTGNFKVFFAATEYTITEEGEDDITCCAYEFGLLAEYEITTEGYCQGGVGWGYWTKRQSPMPFDCPTSGVHYNTTECEDSENACCPDGYFDNTPDSSILDGVCVAITYTIDGCFADGTGPLLIVGSTADTCARITIADLC